MPAVDARPDVATALQALSTYLSTAQSQADTMLETTAYATAIVRVTQGVPPSPIARLHHRIVDETRLAGGVGVAFPIVLGDRFHCSGAATARQSLPRALDIIRLAHNKVATSPTAERV